MITNFPLTLGGHTFTSELECAAYFNIHVAHVCHMLESPDYPGCYYLNSTALTSFLQTLAVMKSTDDNR
jgi:hypothetical protein